MKIVLDANVIIAAFASRGLCESIFELCLESHELSLSNFLLNEIETNLVNKLNIEFDGGFSQAIDFKPVLLEKWASALSSASETPTSFEFHVHFYGVYGACFKQVHVEQSHFIN